MMKILACHNYYQKPGGEDLSFAVETGLLESRGHEVFRFTMHNDTINDMSSLEVARKTIWNRQAYNEIRSIIRHKRPDVMHCTNTFPLVSPAIYYAAKSERVPIVQSLRNYRLLCPNGLFHRAGGICEECMTKKVPWPGILRACYRGSRAGSGVVTAMLGTHRVMRTWNRIVDLYVALTQFSKQQFIRGGLPEDRIMVKPNCVLADPKKGNGNGRYIAFVGRLSEEKGIAPLLHAWARLNRSIRLKIAGDGPLGPMVRAAAERDSRIDWLGHIPPEKISTLVGDASFLIMPSTCYEQFPRSILEAFAKGTPVVASRLGAMMELIDDGRTGLLFEPGDSVDMAKKVEYLFDHPNTLATMREAARRQYEKKFTADRNYKVLIGFYERILYQRCNAATTKSGLGK